MVWEICSITYNCPDTNYPSAQTNTITYSVVSNWWNPPLPTVVTSSFCSEAFARISSSSTSCASFNLSLGTACWVVSCNIYTISTNCTGGNVRLTNGAITTNVCIESAISASVSQVASNAIQVITTTYTNACGYLDTNCPTLIVTNLLAPTILSNWWVVTGPGSYSNSGSGLSGSFTPTVGGSGTITFNSAYQNGCNTNVQNANSVSLGFNVIQMTNVCAVSTPTNRSRLTIGVAEDVNLNLVNITSGTFAWTTTAGSLSSTSGPATTLTAPSNASPSTVVTVSFPGGSCSKTFSVLEPTGIDHADIVEKTSFPKNTAQIAVLFKVFVAPTTVSFVKVTMMEVALAATNVTGYFTNYTPAQLFHSSANDPFDLNEDNSWPARFDYCDTPLLPPVWSDGSFTWNIPGKWWIGTGPTNDFANPWSQRFSITASGTVGVEKFGYTVTRTTNDVYSP